MAITDLEERLITFSVLSIRLAKNIRRSFEGRHLAQQLMRSSTSAALNYGEAKGAESKKDFIHKMRLVLKELRESLVCLKIIKRCDFISQEELLNEADELVAIFVTSLRTAENKSL
ncbi:MAG: four helix bundle protein [Cyclobacteriaceae bacterium]|nr:four helix bundle protein [Cyclobacteriaceae bacterium]